MMRVWVSVDLSPMEAAREIATTSRIRWSVTLRAQMDFPSIKSTNQVNFPYSWIWATLYCICVDLVTCIWRFGMYRNTFIIDFQVTVMRHQMLDRAKKLNPGGTLMPQVVTVWLSIMVAARATETTSEAMMTALLYVQEVSS